MDDPVIVVPLDHTPSLLSLSLLHQEVYANISPAQHLHSLTVMNIYFAVPSLSFFGELRLNFD